MRAGVDGLRQRIGRDHGRLGDLAALAVVAISLPVTHQEHRDMVAGEVREIGEDTMQSGRAGQPDADLLGELAGERRLNRLAPFDAAAWEEPAGPIGMAHEQHAPIFADDHALRAEREPPAQAPEGPEHGRDRARGADSR